MSDSRQQLEKLKQAMAELRHQRAYFTPEAFSQIVLALLEKMRRLQTVPQLNTPTSETVDEIRLVSVMFVDVKDSTLLAQQLDTSDWKSILEEGHQRIAALVAQWDGTVGQYLGDGVLAFFGAQRSRGDDALRCVMCALAVLSAIESYANDVFLQYGVEFAVRIGISTGKLVVGLVGAGGKQELLALGPATNLAARLQAEAKPGTAIIDSATYSRVRQYIRAKPQPLVKVKGFDELIAVYEVEGRSDQTTTTLTQTTIEGLLVLFVGREAELQTIRRTLTQAYSEGHLLCVTIVGDIGMGKSRLLQETLWMARDDGATPLLMSAKYEERDVPYNLLRDWLTVFCQLSPAMSAQTACERIVQSVKAWNSPDAERLAHLMGYLANFGFKDSPYVQEHYADPTLVTSLTARFFEAMARENPLLILVDNLQWADDASVRWINGLADALKQSPVVMVVGARPAYDLTHPTYLADFPTDRHLVITLSALDETTTRQMIDSIIGNIPRLPNDLADLVLARSEGNPLFVMEFLASLFDSNVFQRGLDGVWRFNIVRYDTVLKTLPTGLVEMVQARLDELPQEERQVLQLASIVGAAFWTDIVNELAGKSVAKVLGSLVARGIVERQSVSRLEGEIEYRFLNTLYREVSYEMLPRAKREVMHRQVAHWLVTRIANKGEFFEVLAAQFEAGGQYEASLFTYLEAVQSALERSSAQQTLALIEKGLANARNVQRDTALTVTPQFWLAQAACYLRLGRYDEASASSVSALRLLEEVPVGQLQVVRMQSARHLGVAYTHIGNFDEAHQALARAYEEVDETDNAQMSDILSSHAQLMFYKGRLTDATSYQQRAMHYARNTGMMSHINRATSLLGAIALERGEINIALSCFEDALELHRKHQKVLEEAFDLRHLGVVYLTLRLYERAFSTLELARNALLALGVEDNLTEVLWAVSLIGIGKNERGIAHIKAQEGKPQEDILMWQVAQTWSMFGLLWAGENVSCLQRAKVFSERVKDGNPVFYAKGLLLQGRAKFLLGEPNADTLLRQAVKLEETFAGRELAQAFVWLGDASSRRESKRLYERAAHIAQAIGNSLYHRTDLQYAFLSSSEVRDIFSKAGLKG